MNGAAASGQNFTQDVIRTSRGSAEMNQQPRQGCSKSGLVRIVVRSMERLLVQGHRSWSPAKCIYTMGQSICRFNTTEKVREDTVRLGPKRNGVLISLWVLPTMNQQLSSL